MRGLGETPGHVPRLGEDTRRVLAEAGYSASEIGELERSGVMCRGRPACLPLHITREIRRKLEILIVLEKVAGNSRKLE